MAEPDLRLEKLVGVLRRRGVILPAFEIHGGAAGFYDFGPIGGRLRNRVNQVWLEHWLKLGNIVELSCPTITPYPVLSASGHVGEFSDFLTTCGQCQVAFRTDSLLQGYHPSPDSLSGDELESELGQHNPKCPDCGATAWTAISSQNLMFNTVIGGGKSGRDGFLRPETAQGMFTNFPSLYRHFRQRLPFGAVQVGKGYRNEISPRQGMIRLREFNMAELEYFIDPETEPVHDFSIWENLPITLVSDQGEEISQSIPAALNDGVIRHATVAYFMAQTYDFLIAVGIDAARLRFRQHQKTEMAHYATDCWDAEILGSYGWVECVGIAHRGCYDLEAHEVASGQRLRAWRQWSQPIEVDKEVLTTVGAKAGPAFRDMAGLVKEALEALEEIPTEFPIEVQLSNGEVVTVESEHVKHHRVLKTVNGEWYLPHVVEPAFGIDRIIWHLIDHAWCEVEKEGQDYSVMRLAQIIAPIDVAVLPLFEKDGMGQLADGLNRTICSTKGLFSYYDGSGSIGRRYARADEVGVPWCVTIDHQSLKDGTATIRQRDSQQQTRCALADIAEIIVSGKVMQLFT
jgi:glycyl-tRNA synthetase